MWRARPSTTVSVTVTSGCRDVPDFSANLRAYAHILSMFACDGMGSLSGLPGQRGVDRGRVKAGESLVADQDHGQRGQAELHELLPGRRILPPVALPERHALARQILCRPMAGPSADVGIDGDRRRHALSSLADCNRLRGAP